MAKIDKALDFMLKTAADDSHGYDQINRWGPDYDCSSLIITAWEQAGVPVKSKGGATYTGNMLKAFLLCGFRKVPISKRTKGDVLLNEKHHTAMVVDEKGKTIVQASINENGKTTGGKKGDQTGREICTRAYYNYPWDYCLRYEEPQEAPQSPNKSLAEIAGEVIAGKWGNGTERKQRLTEAGYNYDEVQKEVNKKLKTPAKKFVDYIVTTNRDPLNVRTGPSTAYRVIKQLPKGAAIQVETVANGWAKLSDGNYVSAVYITKK